MATPVLIAFGANVDPLKNLHQGLSTLHREINLADISTVWRTDPLPDPNQKAEYDLGDSYLNGAVLSHIQVDPFNLKKMLKKIEATCCRVPNQNRYAPRPIDLDVVMMGDEIINSPGLTLPDPDILQRCFVALPVAQLAPELVHPVEHKSLAQLAAGFHVLEGKMAVDEEATSLLQSIIK
ncbi:MAG: 2-amino-4-hydroxy-6-hydroxymethyldihydropteridine diphosphokinase [Magnetococcales bacterium]|nr:2-amino-4-hydroxy-6-hydroxymethyldihydropteridine diphosphokinase [Magnetococcales bacterium]